MPRLLPGLADGGWAGAELHQVLEFGTLIMVGGVDVDVQPGPPFCGWLWRLRMIVG